MIGTPDNKPEAGSEPQAKENTTGAARVEKWVYGGGGLVRVGERAGFVPFVLPGELIRLGELKKRASVIESEAAEIVEASPDRISPRCAVFGRCGGCHYQHAPYEFQLARKAEILAETLRRIGKLELAGQLEIVSAEPWHYRNRSQFRIDRARIGYLSAKSHKLVEIEECPISSPAINEALRSVRKKLHDPHWPRFLRTIEMFTNGEQVLLNALETVGDRRLARGFFEWLEQWVPGASAGAIEYRAGDFAYRVSHDSFFQVNRYLTERLLDCALRDAAGESAVDLYAGVGLFTVPLARRFRRVAGVESHAAAVRDMEQNAGRAGGSISAHRAQAEQYLERLVAPPDFVLADPPRSGLGGGVIRHLLRLAPRRLHVVSCDPATLARDLASLTAGGYRVEGAVLIDMFPQTYHIETVARLVKD